MRKNSGEQLSNEKIQQLLAAVGARSRNDTSHYAGVIEYDWRQARYFNLEQLAKMERFAETVAETCVEEFCRLYQADSRISVVSASQCFSSEPDGEQQRNYYIPFGADTQTMVGMLVIPHAVALKWTGHVLGESESVADSDRKLSTLEESFLMDIASGLIGAFSSVYGENLSSDRILSDRSSVDLKGSEELFRIVFEVGKKDVSEDDDRASFLMCCDKLESIAGKSASGNTKLSDAQIAGAVLDHVHQIAVSVRVELGTAMLPLADVMNLQVNDVVVLNKKVTDSIEISVEDRTLFHGHPAQSGEQYAVVVA